MNHSTLYHVLLYIYMDAQSVRTNQVTLPKCITLFIYYISRIDNVMT